TAPFTPIYVLVKYFGCKYEHSIMLNLMPIEEITVSVVLCDFDSDNQEIINLSNHTSSVNAVLTPAQTTEIIGYSYYSSLSDAREGYWWTVIPNTTQYSIEDGQMSVYVRVEFLNLCPAIV